MEIRAIINRFKKKLNQSIDSDIRKIQGKSIMHFERALLSRIFQYLALYSCCCNANEVLAFLHKLYMQKCTLYLQLHKKVKPKGKSEILVLHPSLSFPYSRWGLKCLFGWPSFGSKRIRMLWKTRRRGMTNPCSGSGGPDLIYVFMIDGKRCVA